jgi:membrane protease YdiL (CAAX protease family)
MSIGNKQSKFIALARTSLLVVLATFVDDYIWSWIPLHKLPLTHFWIAILGRSIASLLILICLALLYPKSLRRLNFKMNSRRSLIGLGFVAFMEFPSLFGSNISLFSIPQMIQGIVFSIFIGIHEELFSRGLIYGALEKYGVWIAAGISSIHFGLLHLGNIFWGGQSVSYTLGQVVTAGAFGFVCVGLMLYTGNIWIPILMHGLVDSPMQFEKAAQFTKEVTGRSNWGFIALYAIVYVLIGWAFIQLSDPVKEKWLINWLRSVSLLS